MKTKFLLMGLPATGKTTTLKAYIDILKTQGMPCNLILTDHLINQRIRAEDKVIQQYQKDRRLKISPHIFIADNPDRAFIAAYGEPAFCDLEERLLVDMINSSGENDWFDFGARALTLPRVVKAIEAKKIIPILLYAEPETIIARLEKNDGWKQRPTYWKAAKESVDGKGWKANAEKHRHDRLPIYFKLAKIIISVEKFVSGPSPSDQDAQQSILYKRPEEIAQEIFMAIKKLEQATSSDDNNQMKFFSGEPSEKILPDKQFQSAKARL